MRGLGGRRSRIVNTKGDSTMEYLDQDQRVVFVFQELTLMGVDPNTIFPLWDGRVAYVFQASCGRWQIRIRPVDQPKHTDAY